MVFGIEVFLLLLFFCVLPALFYGMCEGKTALSKCWGGGAMSEVRTGWTGAKERSASRLRVEPPVADT